ncbi:hypothetical protein BpHYR1_034765 [Brachionus plicatilis]|uniref:Uncharacterized protein n=1 Tax=Brachionus plicatilis TaxID=10195 RepID=A0A3M7S2G0_BRAPC|nr:hypothetical protein BpHYR1_034765 [Brachionus plicatilis]
MFSTKKEIIDYFDRLTNEIDIKFERKIQKLDDDEAISKQNVTRKLISDKINEIVQFNLEHFGKKVKSCFLLKRKVWNHQIIDNLSDTESIFVEATSLIIFNEILSLESILNIKKKLRDVEFKIEGNFEKNFKLHLIHELIYESYDAIIDLSDSDANLVKQIEITDFSKEINEADLNFENFLKKYSEILKIY